MGTLTIGDVAEQAGVNIEVLYSDHDNRLILVVDDMAKGQAVSERWSREWDAKSH